MAGIDLGALFHGSSANQAPAFDLSGVLSQAPSDPQAAAAYWQKQLNDYVANSGGIQVNDKGQTDPNIAFLQGQVKSAQTAANAANSSDHNAQNAAAGITKADIAANTAANAQAETNRHNQATEKTAADNAANTVTHDKNMEALQAMALQIQAESAANTKDYHDAIMAAKNDANAINAAKEQFNEKQALIQDRINYLKDVATSLTSTDSTDMQTQVSQANERNSAAMSYVPNALNGLGNIMGKYGAAGNAGLVSSALSSVMAAGPKLSQAMSGSAVPVGQLSDQHKQQIYQLVTQMGMPFDEAVQTTAQQAAAGNAPPPTPAPGYSVGNSAAGGAMGPSGFQVGQAAPIAGGQ